MDTSVDKCLAFCQSLAMSGQKFSFTLSIGKDSFSFNNKELGSSSCVKRKKKSPSQVRREQRRKEERSLKKAAEATEKVAEASEFQCSQCDSNFKTEEDLNAHIGEVHTAPVLPTPEKERAPNQVAELLLTPGGIGPGKERSHPPISDINLTSVLGEGREEPPSSQLVDPPSPGSLWKSSSATLERLSLTKLLKAL